MTVSMHAEAAKAVSGNGLHCAEDDPDWVEAVGTNHADRSAATDGCLRLLKAQLATGAHWIRDPAQLAMARASVGLQCEPV